VGVVVLDTSTMDSFKQWLELEAASFDSDQRSANPTSDAVALNRFTSDYFTKDPDGPDMLSKITQGRNSQLGRVMPQVGADIIKFAGPEAKGYNPAHTFGAVGQAVFGSNKQPTFFRKLAAMRKFMKKMKK
jgi:hypothetical protein